MKGTTGTAQAGKRLLDLVLASALLVVAAPLLVLAALAILVTDGRPVLFRQERVGRHGKRFKVLKLRTMVRDAERLLDGLRERNERTGPLFKLSSDPRITRVGRVLRRSSIDELPQLINVLRGDMSLVGPRPALPAEAALFHPDVAAARQEVRPGITGLWQVRARHSASFEAYNYFDRVYVETRTIRLDLAILFLTIPAVITSALRRPVVDGLVRGTLTWPPAAWIDADVDARPRPALASSGDVRG